MSEANDLFGEKRTTPAKHARAGRPADLNAAKRTKAIDRNQCFWGAIDVDKLVEQDHAVRGIWEMVGRLDLSRMSEKIKSVEGKAGQSSWDPRMLTALWIYGISEAVTSARELSRMCEYEPACRWLTGLQSVNYHTLSDFRTAHKAALDDIFAQVLALLSADGLIEMKRIAHDGTKVKALASTNSFRRKDRIRDHWELARQQVEALDSAESGALTQRMIEARKRAAAQRQRRLEDALKELEQIETARQESDKEKVRVSETDPQARVMKQAGGGFAPSYNVQISSDAAQGIIVGVDVTQAGNDCDQLIPAIETVEANTGKKPEQVLVDGGYTMKNSNIEAMAERGMDLVGPVPESNIDASMKRRGVEPEFYPEKFQYDPATDTLRCPAGKPLTAGCAHQAEGHMEYTYKASAPDCRACRFQSQCCPKRSPRRVTRIEHSPAVIAFRARMQTEPFRQLYRCRSRIAEFPNAWIKDKFQLRQFRLRGRQKVRTEAVWACLTYNIQQWIRLRWKLALLATA